MLARLKQLLGLEPKPCGCADQTRHAIPAAGGAIGLVGDDPSSAVARSITGSLAASHNAPAAAANTGLHGPPTAYWYGDSPSSPSVRPMPREDMAPPSIQEGWPMLPGRPANPFE